MENYAHMLKKYSYSILVHKFLQILYNYLYNLKLITQFSLFGSLNLSIQ